jgi:quercetin dioxygenase-like cupin family protein
MILSDNILTITSYVYVPAGVKHESGGVEDSETIFFIEQSGKFDIVPVNPPNEK